MYLKSFKESHLVPGEELLVGAVGIGGMGFGMLYRGRKGKRQRQKPKQPKQLPKPRRYDPGILISPSAEDIDVLRSWCEAYDIDAKRLTDGYWVPREARRLQDLEKTLRMNRIPYREV